MEFSYKSLFISAVCVAAVGGIGYAVYFDYKRRNDGNFRKELKKKKKAVKKEVDEEQKDSQSSVAEAAKKLATMFKAIKDEPLPDSQEEREAYLFNHLNQGEILANRGPSFYEESAGHIFRAVVCCPNPLELVMLVEKMLPKGCYDVVLGLFSLEIKAKQAEFLEYYQEYPPSEMNVKLEEDASQSITAASDPIKKHNLIADKDFSEGQVIYTEKPIISVLHPGLEGKNFCSVCLKAIDGEAKSAPVKFINSVFCSDTCISASENEFPKSIAGKEKALDVFTDAKETHNMIPSLMSRILNRVFIEHEQQLASKSKTKYTAMQHVERFIAADIKIDESRVKKETELVQKYLRVNTEGVEQVVNLEYYMGMKGKLVRGAFGIVSAPEHPDVIAVAKSNEGVRSVAPGLSTGCGIYVTSSYLRDGMFEANTQAEFRNKDNTLTLVATKPIKKGDILTVASFTPTNVSAKSDNETKAQEFPPLTTESEKAPLESEVSSKDVESSDVPSYAEIAAEISGAPEKSDAPSYAEIAAEAPSSVPEKSDAPSYAEITAEAPSEITEKSDIPSYADVAAEAPSSVEKTTESDNSQKTSQDAPSYADVAAEATKDSEDSLPESRKTESTNEVSNSVESLTDSQEENNLPAELSSSQEYEKVDPIEKDSEL